MTSDLPRLPAPDPARLNPVSAGDLVLSYLAYMKSAAVSAGTIARSLGVWGADQRDVECALARLQQLGLAERGSAQRWRLSPEGRKEARSRFGAKTAVNWAAFAERHFVACALRLDPLDKDVADYLGRAHNVYAAALAVLFSLADPASFPPLARMRGALIWRIAAARFPDLMPPTSPSAGGGPEDAVTRALYLSFAGLKSGGVDAATPALLRRALSAPFARSASAIRRALVRAALQQSWTPGPSLQPGSGTEDFAQDVFSIAKHVQTPKRAGGYFGGSQVAIAQLYDEYAAQKKNGLSLDQFKAQLWHAVRNGARFHLTRLDIPELMEDELRQRSATRTLTGDVVHFVVLD